MPHSGSVIAKRTNERTNERVNDRNNVGTNVEQGAVMNETVLNWHMLKMHILRYDHVVFNARLRIAVYDIYLY